MRWNTRAGYSTPCWAKTILTTNPGSDVGPSDCSKTRSSRWSKKPAKLALVNPRRKQWRRNWAILSAISSACSTAPFAPQVTLSARASWKPAAKRLSVRAANNQVCSGPGPVQRTCWHCGASTAVDAWTRSGNTGSINTPNVMTPSPCLPEEEFCPPPDRVAVATLRLPEVA